MQIFRRITGIMLTLGVLVCLPGVAGAQIPNTISYQGILTNAAVPPVVVPDGNYNLIFSLYTVASGGSAFWTEFQNSVPLVEGRFHVELGSVSPLTGVSFGAPYFLGITVKGEPELPRIPLTASAYSLNARRVATVDSATGGTIMGNINLQTSTASAGNILRNGAPFIHGVGTGNTFIGLDAGNLTMSGAHNTASGCNALASNTTGAGNTANGENALYSNTTGTYNTASGTSALALSKTAYCNTASGYNALFSDTTGSDNTASGTYALYFNTTGSSNTANGRSALFNNTTGNNNTAIGYSANVSTGNLTNATAIGANTIVNASNKIRLGNTFVTVIEGQVAYTYTSDRNQKENFKPVDGDEVLSKIRGLNLTSWNYIGHNPKRFRHYGPVAQEFFAAFGHDSAGTCGDSTTINSGDMAGIMMIAIQTLVKENEVTKAENAELKAQLVELKNAVDELRDAERATTAER